ncbi:hypothetical protein GCM10023148_51050 [Actinokineospora soli]
MAAALGALAAHPAAASTGCQGWMMYLPNAGFEQPSDGSAVPMWCTGEGPDAKGVDRGTGWSRTGANNAYIEAVSTGRWNAITQHVVVPAGRTVELSGYVRTSSVITAAYFGVRHKATGAVHREVRFGPLTGGYHRLAVRFPAEVGEYTAFAGFWSPGGFSWLLVDDVATTLVG